MWLLSTEAPWRFALKLIWWCWILFCLSVKPLIFPSKLNEILAGYSNLGCTFFSSHQFSVYPAIPLWPAEFLLQDQLLALWGSTYMLFFAVTLLLLTFFSLCLTVIAVTDMSWHISIWVHSVWDFLDLGGCFLSHVREVSNYSLLKYFLRPFVFLLFFCCCSFSVLSDSLWPRGLQQVRLPCLSPSPRACLNSCPLSQWCHPTISSSVVPFSSCLQSFPALGSFLISHFFPSGGKVLELQLQDQSFQWIFRIDFLYHGLVWSPYNPWDSQESSPAP